ncbi:hypothetical protein RDWZM_007668 [Blomia tropicalis]|uniref:J domain-containing protein n=1 Tax=Blomia tropicalis TaxID=40697 RepID=A0A9Q0M063_BLOTA|nr:hypothetical protein RDWZM_007668 [Blomia tropicalis]
MTCNKKEIRLAYLDLCKKYHPDKVVNDGDKMKARFQLINEAYNCLSKKSKRSMYDQSLRYNTEPWQQYRPQYYQRQQTYYYDHRQHREQQEFYQKMYRMHQEYQQKHPPNQNDDIKVDLKFIGVLLTTIILSSIIMVTILQIKLRGIYRDYYHNHRKSQWYRGKDVNDEDGKSKNNMTKVNRSYNDLFRALEDTENGHQQQQQQKQMTIEDFVDEVNRN